MARSDAADTAPLTGDSSAPAAGATAPTGSEKGAVKAEASL